MIKKIQVDKNGKAVIVEEPLIETQQTFGFGLAGYTDVPLNELRVKESIESVLQDESFIGSQGTVGAKLKANHAFDRCSEMSIITEIAP